MNIYVWQDDSTYLCNMLYTYSVHNIYVIYIPYSVQTYVCIYGWQDDSTYLRNMFYIHMYVPRRITSYSTSRIFYFVFFLSRSIELRAEKWALDPRDYSVLKTVAPATIGDFDIRIHGIRDILAIGGLFVPLLSRNRT